MGTQHQVVVIKLISCDNNGISSAAFASFVLKTKWLFLQIYCPRAEGSDHLNYS